MADPNPEKTEADQVAEIEWAISKLESSVISGDPDKVFEMLAMLRVAVKDKERRFSRLLNARQYARGLVFSLTGEEHVRLAKVLYA